MTESHPSAPPAAPKAPGKSPPAPGKPMRTTADLFEALLTLAGEARDQTAEATQGDLLCKATDSLIKLTKLQLDAAAVSGTKAQIGWLGLPALSEPDRLSVLLNEQSVIEKELHRPEISPDFRKRLGGRLTTIKAEIKLVS